MTKKITHTLIVNVLNQVFEIEKKVENQKPKTNIARNIDRIKEMFSECGYVIHNPLGEAYTDTRTDCEAQILTTNARGCLHVAEVIKPIIRFTDAGFTRIIQKAIVIAQEEATVGGKK